ncbi:MAG TPA: VanZ family protein [Candidatus Pullichristensenella stercoripullorum]|nr:VanZ family protein [Candidatus Pullichristensenella stercoripullorum]
MTAPRTRLRFLPAILWLAVIFFLSSQTGEQTAAISLAIARWLARLFPGVSLTSLHLALRKAAHIGVYFVEGALLFPALYGQKGRAGRALALTVALCALIAVVDEAHKLAIPGRHCSWPEAALNFLGALPGVALALAIVKRKEKRERRRPAP